LLSRALQFGGSGWPGNPEHPDKVTRSARLPKVSQFDVWGFGPHSQERPPLPTAVPAYNARSTGLTIAARVLSVVSIVSTTGQHLYNSWLIMVALCNRADHNILFI